MICEISRQIEKLGFKPYVEEGLKREVFELVWANFQCFRLSAFPLTED